MVAAMASLVMWLAGYRAERQCLHRHYQASSVRHKRVLSYLSLAEEVIRHEPDKVRRLNIGNEMKKLGKVVHGGMTILLGIPSPQGEGLFGAVLMPAEVMHNRVMSSRVGLMKRVSRYSSGWCAVDGAGPRTSVGHSV